MIYKKTAALLLAMILLLGCVGCSSEENENQNQYRVCFITDAGSITDQSFNQFGYEAVRDYCKAHDLDYTYKIPQNQTEYAMRSMVDLAVAENYNILVLCGYTFAETIVNITDEYPDVSFIGLDISESDIGSAALGSSYQNNPQAYNPKDYYNEKNTFLAVYEDHTSGFLAGYTAVMLGYRRLGYLGGQAIPSVVRYGYGYLQGIEAAAKALGVTNEISVNYAYGGQFFGSAEITAVMDTWYAQGTEVVFSCGGSIYASVCEAAIKYGGKVIGVDTDQKAVINQYKEGLCVTSAMKNLNRTVNYALDAITVSHTWDNLAGRTASLGLISSTDPEKNFVGLPLDSTQWNEKFTEADYKKLLEQLIEKKLTVSSQTDAIPAVSYTLNMRTGTIK